MEFSTFVLGYNECSEGFLCNSKCCISLGFWCCATTFGVPFCRILRLIHPERRAWDIFETLRHICR
jgi:hypothetical protein